MIARNLLALLLLALSLPALADRPALVISTDNTPLDRKVLEEISRAALDRLGMDLRLVSLPSERSLRTADLGGVDGEGLRVAGLSDHFRNLVQVPEPYVRIGFVAFATDPAIEVDGWDDLAPYHVAFLTGWKIFERNTAGARAVTRVDDARQLFRMLERGRVDVALYTRADGEALVREMGLKGIVPTEPALESRDLYLYLNRRHEAIVTPLAEQIRAMKADGTHARILATALGR